jgi:predicted glycosyltransferase involved in capsule biosynthesis
MNQNYNFIKNKNIIDNKSNEINPFKGLPAYFVRKGKKQIIKKYFKLFFFRILQDSLIKKDKEENFINLSDLFFKIY